MSQSPARKARRAGALPPRRNLTAEECLQLQEMQRLVNGKKYEATSIKGNTALVPDGQKVAAQAEAIAALLDNEKNRWVAALLTACGYLNGTKCNINLTTGEIELAQ